MRSAADRRHRLWPASWRLVSGGAILLVASLAARGLFGPRPVRAPPPRIPLPGAPRASSVMPPPPPPVVHPGPDGEMILPAAQYEPRDAGGRFIAAAFAVLLISLAVATLGVLWLFPLPRTDRAINVPLPLYPAPRLQTDPRQDLQRFLAWEKEQQTTYGWIDKDNGVVRIPINEAMRKIAERGIPGWPGPQHTSTASAP